MNTLRPLLSATPDLRFAVLVGSRANCTNRPESDWDIAVAWRKAVNPMMHLARHESLRQQLAQQLAVPDSAIDLIDLATAGLAMRANVVEEGRVLCINDELDWAHFCTRTWRELEDFYWERAHAA